MSSMLVVAKNTFKEVIRDRVLYGLVIFATLVMLLSLVLGQLSFYEQERISLNFGFAAIKISLVMLSVFVGSSLVYKEIERKTVLTLIVRPISRTGFLFGKFLGLCLVVLTLMVGLSLILFFILKGYGLSWDHGFLLVLFGILLESMIMLSLVFFFGVFVRPMLTVMFSLSFYLIGHSVDDLVFFADKSKDLAFIYFTKICQRIIPDLERVNWSFALSSENKFDLLVLKSDSFYIFNNGIYAISWILLLLSLSALIFRRKDLV